MSTILTRTLSGAIYITIMLGSVLLGPYFFGIVQLLFLSLCLIEYSKLNASDRIMFGKVSFLVSGIISYLIILFFIWGYFEARYLLLIILVIFKIFIGELFLNNKHPLQNIGITLAGLVYIVLPFSILNFLFCPGSDFSCPTSVLLVGFFIIIWGNDTFAYLSGMAFGKHKLFERISPKKSWEGTIGGALFAMIVAVVFSYFYKELDTVEWIGYSLTIIIFGTFGDLFESLIKRSLGLKDSGNIMPGHGGILDRFDSILMAAPFAYLYIVFVLN